jgi:hypothetical protein
MYGMEGLIEGRIAHYVLSEADVQRIEAQRKGKDTPNQGNPPAAGEHVPMIVVKCWSNEFGPDRPGVNGQVMLDGNDTLWVTSAQYDPEKGPGSWHWIERA